MARNILSLGVFLCVLYSVVVSEKNDIFPKNKEITYLWKANIAVGSSIPVKISSVWNLNATIIIQNSNEGTNFQLKDISSSEGLINEQNVLLLPFQAMYNGDVLESIAITEGDTDWSVNIKRALVSLLQLDKKHLAAGHHAFESEEIGLYGKCKIQYIVQPTKGDIKQVKKIVDVSSCEQFPATFWSSSPKFLCPASYQSELVSHSEREYNIALDSPVVIQNVSTRGSIVLQPFQSQAEAHHSLVSQSLMLKAFGPIVNKITSPVGLNTTHLHYKEIILDGTHGLPPSNKTVVLKEIMDMLEELGNSLWWEVGSRGLNNETVFSLVNLMWWLELEDWEQLYQVVTIGTSYQQETMQHLFWELVPEVGSTQSALFIRDLVKTGRIKGLLAGRLLVNFPFYQRKPTEDLLFQCEEFLHFGARIEKDVRNSAILSFATLLRKTCANGCKTDTIDRFAKLYLDRFTDSRDYEDRMLYLQGLSNIELAQSLDYLAPFITGRSAEVPKDSHIQFLATWAVLNSAYTNPKKVFEIFWPLLVDRSQTLQVRVAAMTLVMLSKPTSDCMISLYWYMQTEPSLQLYNFFYTTVKSLASTTYPCYTNLGLISSQLSRFVVKKGDTWATGNYLLDYEDKERGYGGLLQLLSIGSERTGLPTVFIFMTEQHALGISTAYVLYIKAEGVGEAIKQQLHNMTTDSSSINFQKISQLLKSLKVPVKGEEEIHLEFIFKVDGMTVITQYLNSSSFHNITRVVKRLSSVYFEFSVNYQRLMFPLFLTRSQPSDIGIPSLVQMRSGSLISARGSVSQDDEGRARNAELDLRYSWNGITSLQLYNPLSNKWHGATRSRSLHIRLPFAVQLHLDVVKNFYKIKSIQHRDYMAGSRIGIVWHAVSKLSQDSSKSPSHAIKEEWTMNSQDLGARLGASIFDCPGKSTVLDALQTLKKAFLTKEKNYHMIPGGVALLGLFSLKEQLAFQPPGGNCGLMLSFTPLLSQVEPVLVIENNQLRLQMSMKNEVLWEIQAGSKKLFDGNKELTFKLYHTPSTRIPPADIWRVIQFEGAFVLPSGKASVFNPPAPLTGYTFISWGDSSPTQANLAAVLDVKVEGAHSENHTRQCPDLSPKCLQSISALATQQVAKVQYVNLPGWLLTAAHALFPEHVQTESSSTTIGFSFPSSLPPWNTKGLCAVNSDSVLTMDNITVGISLATCYTVLVADCSHDNVFAVLLKRMAESHNLAMKVYVGSEVVELLPSNNTIDVFINENIKLNSITEDYNYGGSNESNPIFRVYVRQEGVVEVELGNGVLLQHYMRTAVALVPGVFRGYTCGLCADFNSDTNMEPVVPYTQC